jgi:predicted N-acetyltransferase YhbS
MTLSVRRGAVEDADECGRILYEAFGSIDSQHNFPRTFASQEVATTRVKQLLSDPRFYSVVGEVDQKIAGSNFLDERSVIAGLGPISVDPPLMNAAIGRQLMRAALDRGMKQRFAGIRLVQTAWHYRSFSLYSKLGFDTREMLSAIKGKPIGVHLPGYEVRPASERDLPACNRICESVHGHDREGEVFDAVRQGTASVVERLGAITGYATCIGWFGHAVANTSDDLKALIGTAQDFLGPGFLVPSRNGELLRWCLNHGLRIFSQQTLMTIGLYNEPSGAYLPSIIY